jgi:hypothetical protein
LLRAAPEETLVVVKLAEPAQVLLAAVAVRAQKTSFSAADRQKTSSSAADLVVALQWVVHKVALQAADAHKWVALAWDQWVARVRLLLNNRLFECASNTSSRWKSNGC